MTAKIFNLKNDKLFIDSIVYPEGNKYKSASNLIPKVLFESQSGEIGDIVLNDSAANYKYLEFFYTWETSNSGWGSTKVENANGKIVCLDLTYDNGTYYYLATSRYTINEKNLTLNSSVRWRLNTNGSQTRTDTKTSGGSVRVYKIIGYN